MLKDYNCPNCGKTYTAEAGSVAALCFLCAPVPAKHDSQARKNKPLFSGCMMYFPDALLAVAEHSKKGNDKHNPGQPLHWSRDKSKDHADCIARHLVDIGPNWDAVDPETQSLHAQALAWRALALLQAVLERSKKCASSN